MAFNISLTESPVIFLFCHNKCDGLQNLDNIDAFNLYLVVEK